jgi:hypothetical protein
MWQHDERGLRFHIIVPRQFQAHSRKYIAGFMRGWLKRRSKPPEQSMDEKLWNLFLEAHPRFKGHRWDEPDPFGEVFPHYVEWRDNLFRGLKPTDARQPGETRAAWRIRTGLNV